MKIDLDSSTVYGEGTDQVFAATQAVGSQFADLIIGPPVAGTVLEGRGGNDQIGDSDSGKLLGGAGNDTLTGAIGNDTLGGGEGSDTLTGGDGGDVLGGGGAADILNGGTGADIMSGGDGIDTADYSSAPTGVHVGLDGRGFDGGPEEGDNVQRSVENVLGSNFDDAIQGSATGNRLNGRGGIDTLVGRGGGDVLIGGPAADFLRGLAGDDRLAAHDNTADAEIDCGEGTGDAATIDGGVDPSPAGCESVIPR